MEHYTYNRKEIIGIDHGFGNIKCRHVVFRSGVKCGYDFVSKPMDNFINDVKMSTGDDELGI